MVLIFVSLILLLNLMALLMFRRLHLLRSISQIQAEVELEMHSRAHQLLVRRDQLEVGLVKETAEADEQWKGDLAEYMEEYEQEALLRARQRLNRV
ncbi:hypothetical protein RNAN_1625 [Rheinheimera nanhaiensis E407-8]|uniref:Uncharacterized protein n=2 Tax=Rheinheimera TaxID=67575 RepID=I1DX67_9GAMM|nr:hypothetical protein RNAN_1625 [Rheinheimera nanhaiensis E407-8]